MNTNGMGRDASQNIAQPSCRIDFISYLFMLMLCLVEAVLVSFSKINCVTQRAGLHFFFLRKVTKIIRSKLFAFLEI